MIYIIWFFYSLDEEVRPTASVTPPRPIARSRGTPRPPRHNLDLDDDYNSSNESKDGTEWSEIEERNHSYIKYIYIYRFQSYIYFKHCLPKKSQPSDYMKLFFTPLLLNMFVKYTRMYAQQYLKINAQRL